MPFRLVHIILLLVAFAGTGDVWGQEEGLASYYHNRFHGRKAASGRVHDADELVAPTAHILSALSCVSPTCPI